MLSWHINPALELVTQWMCGAMTDLQCLVRQFPQRTRWLCLTILFGELKLPFHSRVHFLFFQLMHEVTQSKRMQTDHWVVPRVHARVERQHLVSMLQCCREVSTRHGGTKGIGAQRLQMHVEAM